MQVFKEGVIIKFGFWKIVQGYLFMFVGSFYDVCKLFGEVWDMDLFFILQQQFDVFELALYINVFDDINYEIENKIVDLQNMNEVYKVFEDFLDFFCDWLIELYEEIGQFGKAFLMQYLFQYLKFNIKFELIENLLVVICKVNFFRLEE